MGSLEVQLQSELDDARIIRTGHLAKVAGAEVRADTAIEGVAEELGMVPDVEELGAELEIATRASLSTKFLKEEMFQLSRPGPHTSCAGCCPAAGCGRRIDRRCRTIR